MVLGAGTLYCKMRWEPQISTDCDAGFKSNECLGHVIKKCSRTEWIRQDWTRRNSGEGNNDILKILERELQARKLQSKHRTSHPNLHWNQNPGSMCLEMWKVCSPWRCRSRRHGRSGLCRWKFTHGWRGMLGKEQIGLANSSQLWPPEFVTGGAEESCAFWRGMSFSRWCLMSVVSRALQDVRDPENPAVVEERKEKTKKNWDIIELSARGSPRWPLLHSFLSVRGWSRTWTRTLNSMRIFFSISDLIFQLWINFSKCWEKRNSNNNSSNIIILIITIILITVII